MEFAPCSGHSHFSIGSMEEAPPPTDHLGDALVGAADLIDGEQRKLRVEEVVGDLLHAVGESGRKHERLPGADRRHVGVREEIPHRLRESRHEHPVRLVDHLGGGVNESPPTEEITHHELQLRQADDALLDRREEPPRGRHENVDAAAQTVALEANPPLQLTQSETGLGENEGNQWGNLEGAARAAVEDADADGGAVGELPRLVEDLPCQLACRRHDQRRRLRRRVADRARQRQQLRDDRQQIGELQRDYRMPLPCDSTTTATH